MRRFALLLSILTLFCNAYARPTLNKIYHYDYGPVTRLVLAFDRMPVYRVDNAAGDRRITIHIDNCEASRTVIGERSPGGPVLSSTSVQTSGDGLQITIGTRQRAILEPFKLEDGVHKIVLDIYNTKDPVSGDDVLALARFYYLVHFYSQALDYYADASRAHPELSQIHYYWGKILSGTGRASEAKSHFAQVKSGSEEYTASRRESGSAAKPTPEKKITPTKQPEKTPPAPTKTPAKVAAKAEPAKTPAKAPEKVPVKPGDEAPVKAETPDTSVPVAPASADTAKASPAEADSMSACYQRYYGQAGSYTNQLFLLGKVAMTCSDYTAAIRYYGEVLNHLDPKSPRFTEAHQDIASCYAAIGMTSQAKLHRALAGKSYSVTGSNTPFLQIPLPLWLALALALGISLVVIFLASLIRRKRNEPPDFTPGDVEPERIAEGYRRTYDEPGDIEEIEDVRTSSSATDPAPEPVIEPQLGIKPDFDVYHPPIIAEELSPEEDAQLEREENEEKPRYESINYDLFQKSDSLFDGLEKTEAKANMIRRLARDGWDAEAIAKELHVSQNEVDFVLKTE
jgi:tetratricopeptide (TPR) repeat protein